MTTLIKICGLKQPEEVEASIEAGATHIGLNFYEPSPRSVDLRRALELADLARGKIKIVALAVNADVETTARIIDHVQPDIFQFHGNETPEWIKLVRDRARVETWKALGVRDAQTLENSRRYEGVVDRLLFDAPAKALPGGNGEAFRWDLLKDFEHRTAWGLAGGLTPHNVASAIRQTGTQLVDTSSGVESEPGVKNVDLICAFCKAALEA